jgi:hypothetical protein
MRRITMNRSGKTTIRLGGLLGLALGAVALMLAMAGSAVAKGDGNHDRIPDRWERHHHLSLQVNQSGRDQDHDGLRNRAEFRAGDNPRDRDSDGDGVMDGSENAGTIASFDATSGRLTISLFGGDTVSGLVTAATEIKCEGVENEAEHHHRRRHAEDRRLLSGEPEPGDDHGRHGNEAGDDNGGDCTTADLTAGTVVQEADLELGNGSATFDEVELAH